MTTQLRTFALLGILVAVGCGPSPTRVDGGPVTGDAAPIGDAFGGPDFGEQCTTAADCDNGGYCVDGQNSDICTYTCDVGCPPGWNCRITDVAGTLVSLCLPQKFDFCKPCTEDVQCNGGVCVHFETGGFCLADCPFEGDCPNGYACGPDPTGQHTANNYCVPTTGECTCTADQEGTVRTCQTMNAVGTCYGLETCTAAAGGWSGCTATTASTEVCDGLDNDCDQLIDDGVSGSACSNTVAGVGTCPGVQQCQGASGVACIGKTPMGETCNYLDDDCDNLIDETYPTLTNVCSAGIGGCERFGTIRCTTLGTGTECSAVAGDPISELCNGLDDNCNTMIDETFTTLGDSCAVGVGACARQGNLVCSTNGATTQCSVTAGTPSAETCNGLDDNCNNAIDEGFKNQGTGFYDQNTACGSCTTDCTVLYALPNASGVCSTGGATPACAMVCAANSFNVDNATSNGCELVLDPGAIYVSTDDPAGADDATCGLGPVGTGTGHHPCLTIAMGISRAIATSRTRVRVANGIYDEAVTISNGINLLGGHRPDTWQRDISGSSTLIDGVGTIAATNHDYTVRATGITSATLFEGFVVTGSVNAKVGGNSYAIYVATSTASLSLVGNRVFGGRGGPGGPGPSGGDGPNGANGAGRNPTLTTADAAYDAHIATGTGACNASNNRQHPNGGVTACGGGDDVSGGNGGGNQCPASASSVCTGCNALGCTSCTFVTATSTTGFAGQPGAGGGGGAGGAGAARGDDMILVGLGGNSYPCFIPQGETYGLDGANGARGANGTAGLGCTATTGTVVGGNWVGAGGGSGASGAAGGGGGGGGAGGGAKCQNCQSGEDNLGGHGGGGGAAGCGGAGGGSATPGGGAFDIFIVGTAAPVITGNTLLRGEGGVGGSGGAGGKGGVGGMGAPGGTTGVPAVFCTDTAGRGGNGGDGGHGAGGGGGCGGSSFGIYTSGLGTGMNYCMAAANNSFSGGAGGSGGPGGYSIIGTGGAGAIGALTNCSFN